jgi:predicted nucleotidyltransferase
MLDKHIRAEIALDLGVDLVLELPFPYSSSTAEIFASAGVEIAMQIGCSHLAFGIENCDINYLSNLANVIDSNELKDAIKPFLDDKKQSYIVAKEDALKALGYNTSLYSNDMLAVEYIRAINKKGAKITPFAIKRVGAGYNDTSKQEIMSASGIREDFYATGKISTVPNEVQEKYSIAIKEGKVLDIKKTKDFLYRLALVIPKEALIKAYDSCNEIATIIKDSANNSKNGEEFLLGLSSKSYTRARICRTILYAIYGVTNVDKAPKFTRLLGANKNGREILSSAKKSSLTVVTKRSDAKYLDENDINMLDILYEIDKMHLTLMQNESSLKDAYSKKPILK